ncbi:hypothetical protein B0H21DRAFT_877511 [Amylocystis lapponica]|nr:hypothetical protein B0H21DRAFT_877511 [Amylocystis lapponica]
MDISSAPTMSAAPASLPVNTALLPIELVDVLNNAYFLHMLATDPERVLPPGKSLLSALSRPNSSTNDGEPPSLHDRVEDIVHKAFWDEALQALSNPEPSVQLPRLKRLYEDLYEALVPLLPPTHPVLVMLSSPLSPTSAPLRSATTHLREVLACLRERCAPARDAYIDTLSHRLDDMPSNADTEKSAKAVVEAVRSLLKLAEAMKDDLSQFVLGTMGEKQLRAVVVAQAKQSERELVLKLWSPARTRELWQRWVEEPGPAPLHDSPAEHSLRRAWVARLIHALGSTSPVACIVPSAAHVSSPPAQHTPDSDPDAPAPNLLPPPLFFPSPTLLYLQNYLQALVIAASLRSLIPLPLPSSGTETDTETAAPPPVARIWALLRAEVDGAPGADSTKLVNLADELVRARRLAGAVDAAEEARVRAAVDRTLRPRDPVFVLLHARLLRALAARLARPVPVRDAPGHLHAGRARGVAEQRPRLVLGPGEAETEVEVAVEAPLVVKGFEDEVLIGAVGEALAKLRTCVEWTERAWADLMDERVVVGDAET